MVDERLLQRVQHAIVREPLDRGHLAPLVLDGQSQARQDPLPVDEHRAGAARALVAPLLRAVKAKMLTHEIHQRNTSIGRYRRLAAVDDDRHRGSPFSELLTTTMGCTIAAVAARAAAMSS